MQLSFHIILMLQLCVGLMELVSKDLAWHIFPAVAEHCAVAVHVTCVTITLQVCGNITTQKSGGITWNRTCAPWHEQVGHHTSMSMRHVLLVLSPLILS